MGWEFAAYPKYQRGRLWYAGAVAVGVGLLLYAVISGNFLFALFVLMFALVMYLTSTSHPPQVRVIFKEDSMAVGGHTYRYKDLKRFWIVYEPPVKTLYVMTGDLLRPRLHVALEDQDPNVVRALLAPLVREELDDADEPWSDILGRLLKL